MSAPLKPTLYFFKLLNCSACTNFEDQMFKQLINDPAIRNSVVLEKVVFGRDEQGVEYSLDPEFPDFKSKVQYAPYVWLAHAYDENQGHHLDARTMSNPKVNLRQQGEQYEYRRDSTYAELRDWILQGARRLQGGGFRSRGSNGGR